ncbi:hypothetical protein JCGZ_19836 [Jatropha curcas]|uniref:Uncharacterized protein n=1 Tax=Jatropha curcas TaxID=180498 RepID=A0A067JY78_JATCU|nr:hypothetical protein JCGZ_19836 [Jatropha curcas]
MSQHLTDEKVDSYVPPSGGIPVGDAASGAVGSDAEHASRVGQAAAGDFLGHAFDVGLQSICFETAL